MAEFYLSKEKILTKIQIEPSQLAELKISGKVKTRWTGSGEERYSVSDILSSGFPQIADDIFYQNSPDFAETESQRPHYTKDSKLPSVSQPSWEDFMAMMDHAAELKNFQKSAQEKVFFRFKMALCGAAACFLLALSLVAFKQGSQWTTQQDELKVMLNAHSQLIKEMEIRQKVTEYELQKEKEINDLLGLNISE